MASTQERRDFKRIVLKLSGEALREVDGHDNISPPIVERIASEIKEAHSSGIEIAVVVGGGNFWRGISAWGLPSTKVPCLPWRVRL